VLNRGVWPLDRWNFALPLPSAELESSSYSKEEIRANGENSVSAFIENSDKAEKIWTNRVFAGKKGSDSRFLCQRTFL